MIDALEFKRHKAAASLFVGFNVLGILLWVMGIALTAGFLAKTDVAPVGSGADLGYFRNVTAAFLLVGHLCAGMLCFFLAHTLRYMASIAEASGKHAMAYLDVVAPKGHL